MNRLYQYIQKYSHTYIQREHFFSQRNAFCNLLTHLPTNTEKVLEKHRTMLSCTKPCKKGRRVARKFQGFVLKTRKEVFKKILVHPKNPTLLEYLHPGAQDAKWNNLLPSLLLLHPQAWTPLDTSCCWMPVGRLDPGGDPVLSCQQGDVLLECTLLLLRQD